MDHRSPVAVPAIEAALSAIDRRAAVAITVGDVEDSGREGT